VERDEPAPQGTRAPLSDPTRTRLSSFRCPWTHPGSEPFLIPLFGTFVYLIFRRPGATEEERQAIDQANRQLAQQYATPSSADQLRTLAELHDSGKLTDDEFAKEKARVIQGSPA